ncbi:MAG: ATP-binding cassette domain-containing protein, partial [Desulfobacterales bacterium]|nr:ATP-binding cassette domain-containing protein [Desulfobacterales bacterium]
MTNQTPPLVKLENISKSFGKVRANRNISLDIEAGKIKALLGENGAGKSTLMSILAGTLRPDEGRILINGEPTTIFSAKTALGAGIGMVHQHFMLIEAMTAAENVFLGQEGGFWLKKREMEKEVAALGEQFGLEIEPSALISDLSMGEKQRVEILKLLRGRSRVLIFDEPTAVLTPAETDQLFDAIRQMAAKGKAIIFISHKLAEVMTLADSVSILRRGELVDETPTSQIASREELAQRMVGREVLFQVEKEEVEITDKILEIKGLHKDHLKDASLEIRQGEILGVVGVAGNGQKPLVETVSGLTEPERGEIRILGKGLKEYYKGKSGAAVLGYIPEDRRGLATCLGLDLVDNFLLTTRRAFCRGPWLLKSAAEEKTESLVRDFDIHPQNAACLARHLSGGNLQKVVLAREFSREPMLIIAEQPT